MVVKTNRYHKAEEIFASSLADRRAVTTNPEVLDLAVSPRTVDGPLMDGEEVLR